MPPMTAIDLLEPSGDSGAPYCAVLAVLPGLLTVLAWLLAVFGWPGWPYCGYCLLAVVGWPGCWPYCSAWRVLLRRR